MAGADYAHCDLEPCLKPSGSTKVFYDADTDIPDGTVIMHPECATKVIAEAEARGYQRATDALRQLSAQQQAMPDDITQTGRAIRLMKAEVLAEFAARLTAEAPARLAAQTTIRSGESQ